MQEQEYKTLYTEGNQIIDNGSQFGTLEQVQTNFPDPNWVMTPLDELPENWHEMTIVNRQLVPATPEVIAERQALKLVAEAKDVEVRREQRYRAETDPIMVEVIEVYAMAHPECPMCVKWLEAKQVIKTAIPKPTTSA